MNSARGTRTVRLQRKQSGLDFSVKGGLEHGIPIVVSWIKERGAAANSLYLGDEILAVNGEPMHGLTHSEAVAKLKGAGATVVLRVRPNQTLGDIFSTESNAGPSQKPHLSLHPAIEESRKEQLPRLPTNDTATPTKTTPTGPLPPGWGEKRDLKTGRPYFENHYTQTSGWTDPRSLTPVSVKLFEWNKLPVGWERFLDEQGDIYYVCITTCSNLECKLASSTSHDTQCTHWDSPRGMRQLQQLTELQTFIHEHKDKLKAEEEELKKKRDLLLEKNQMLDSLSTRAAEDIHQESDNEEDGKEEDPVTDLVDDIMLLNDEVESQDCHVTSMRRHLHSLAEVLQQAHREELGERDEHRTATELALELVKTYTKLKQLETKLLQQLASIGEQLSRDPLSTNLTYMLQLPPTQSVEEVEEREKWLHTLPDKLTGKTNCEMRVELCVMKESYRFALSLQEKFVMFYGKALQVTHKGWEQLMENLASWDFTLLQDQWLMSPEIREKFEKLLMF